MKRNRRLLCMLLALVTLITIAGCGSRKEKPYAPALGADRTGSVRVVGNYANFEALENAFDRFKVHYPKVTLEYVFLDDYNRTMPASLVGENPPDVYMTFPWMLDKPEYASVFEQAENLADPALGINLSCLRQELLVTDPDGAVRMAPIYATTYGMLVNEDLFAASGLKIPTTYEELLAVCEAFRTSGISSPIMGYPTDGALFYYLPYPYFIASVAKDAEAVRSLNAMEPSAGQYLRSTLEKMEDLKRHGVIDLVECAKIENNYQAVILRFFEGDVPMMIGHGDLVSGTKKRETISESFTAKPFKYSFHPVPLSDEGGYFLDAPNVYFCVNRNSADPELTNEFMRFLLTTTELGEMARIKRLLTTAADLSLDTVYAAFGEVPESRALHGKAISVLDNPTIQMRYAVTEVWNGHMTVDEAVAAFGSIQLTK